MLRSLVIVTAALVASTTIAATAQARPGHRFAIFNANSGKKIFDDGRLDGRACAIGKRAVFNPFTGMFIVRPAVKCNFF